MFIHVTGADQQGGDSGGMSRGGQAALALVIIAIFAAVVCSVLFVKLGHGTIDSKFPYPHYFPPPSFPCHTDFFFIL
jgi:hypothetical protein